MAGLSPLGWLTHNSLIRPLSPGSEGTFLVFAVESIFPALQSLLTYISRSYLKQEDTESIKYISSEVQLVSIKLGMKQTTKDFAL